MIQVQPPVADNRIVGSSGRVLYSSAEGQAVAARRALWFVATCSLLAAFLDYRALQLFDKAVLGDVAARSALDSNDTYTSVVNLALLGATLLAGITFIRWLSRAYKNIAPLTGSEPRFGQRWAVWGWFVPILNIWRPKQIINDVWRSGGDSEYPWVATVWWILFLISSNLTLRSAFSDLTARESTQFGLAASVLSTIAAILAIQVIKSATQRQDKHRKARAIEQDRQRTALIQQSRERKWA